MRTLYLRELRRMGPWGLGLLALAGLAAAAAETALLFQGAFLLAALLGVISVAPDTSSGGVAFLARLPLSPSRTIAIKALAAASYWVPALLLALLAGPPAPEALGTTLWVLAVLGYGGFAFGAGLLASVVVARALPAVLVTPSLALLGFGVAAGVPLVVWRIPLGAFAAVSSGVLGASFVAVAGVAFAWGDRHRRSFRPALIALATLIPVVLVGLGVTGIAHAWAVQRAVPELAVGPTPGVVSRDGAHVALQLEGERWTGREQRVAIVPRVGGHAWVPDLRGAVEPQFSPDSRYLLVRDALDPGGWVIDLETRAVRPLEGAAPEGFGFEHAVWSGAGAPFFVRDRGGSLEGFDPTQPCDWDPREPEPVELRREFRPLDGWRLLGVRGSDLVLSHPTRGLIQAGFHAGPGNPCALYAELTSATTLATWPAGMTSAQEVLSPDGSCALALSTGQAERPEVLLTRFGGVSAWLQLDGPGVRLDPSQVSWSPASARVAIACTDGAISVFDTASAQRVAELECFTKLGTVGTEVRVARARVAAPSRTGPVIWSPRGTRLAALGGLFPRDYGLSAQALDLAPGTGQDALVTPEPAPVGVQVGDRYFYANHAGVVFYTSTEVVAESGPLPVDCKGTCDACREDASESPVTTSYAEERAVGRDWIPAAAAFLDGDRVIGLFEPLTVIDLRTGIRTRLLKGGE